MAQVIIPGRTFPVRENLKTLGAKWNSSQKVWMIEESLLPKALEIVRSIPQPSSNTKHCWECGCYFTYETCQRNGGDWGESYCGC